MMKKITQCVFVGVISLLGCLQVQAGEKMEYSTVTQEERVVVGIAQRTSMESAAQDIPKLWEKFYKENFSARIPNKKSEEVFGIYTDYEGDHTKPYTVVIGCEVSKVGEVPEGMVVKTIPTSKFAVFPSRGQIPQCLMETWQKVWSTQLKRRFTADFELYSENCRPDKADVDVYIAILD